MDEHADVALQDWEYTVDNGSIMVVKRRSVASIYNRILLVYNGGDAYPKRLDGPFLFSSSILVQITSIRRMEEIWRES